MKDCMGKQQNHAHKKLGQQMGRHMFEGNIKPSLSQLLCNLYVLALTKLYDLPA